MTWSCSRAAMAIIVIWCVASSFAYGQEEARREIKAILGFDSLPGKALPLMPGFTFRMEEYPELRGYRVAMDRLYLAANIPSRRIDLRRGSAALTIELSLGQTATEAIHSHLLDQYTDQYEAGLGVPGQPVAGLGTFAFWTIAKGDSQVERVSLDFVRNNILLRMTAIGRDPGLTSIAREIDGRLVAGPTYDSLASSGQLPIISAFFARNASVKVGEVTELVIEATDPSGERLTVQLYANDRGDVRLQNGRWVFQGGQRGQALLSLGVSNTRLLTAVRTLTVDVVD